MMKTFKCRGTLGDSYIVNCLIRELATEEPVLIKQCLSYLKPHEEGWEDPVKEIYSLVPNIKVEFVERKEFDATTIPRLWPNIELAIAENDKHKISPMTTYPVFDFPATDQLDIADYIAMSPRGGKADEKHRQMEKNDVDKIVKQFPEQVFVLVGHNPQFINYGGCNVINLIGKTTILEATGIVARAKKFIGIQGLMAYVALSQRLPSIVYTKSAGYDKAFRCRLFNEWFHHCLIYKMRFSEDTDAFERFMR
jgi:hypothetical protein